jgi:hypothetical protein
MCCLVQNPGLFVGFSHIPLGRCFFSMAWLFPLEHVLCWLKSSGTQQQWSFFACYLDSAFLSDIWITLDKPMDQSPDVSEFCIAELVSALTMMFVG